jgi:hypothetical protein
VAVVRRRQPVAVGGVHVPPADKVICWIEDWVTGDEWADQDFGGCEPCIDCAFDLWFLARKRHRDFRAEWMAERGINDHDSWAIWPDGGPRWREAIGSNNFKPTHKRRTI